MSGRSVLAGAVLAGLMGGTAVPLAASSPAAIELDGKTAGWIISQGGARGLVAVHQVGAQLTLAFQFNGLTPQHGYRLLASSHACGTSGGKLFGRGFTTNAKGGYWDPIRIAADASAIVSMRLRDTGLGTTVACSDPASVPLSAVATSIKIRKASIRAVVVVSETSSTTRVLLSISGLTPGGKYQLSGRSGTCAAPGFKTFSLPFTASAKGTALRELQIDLGAAGSIDTSLIRLRNVQEGTIILCRNVG